MGLFCALPLIKSLLRDLPAPIPGADGPALELTLPDEQGRPAGLADLRGRLVLVTTLALADRPAPSASFAELRALQRRLRGLAQVLSFFVLCDGEPQALTILLDQHRARRPQHRFVLDAGGQGLQHLRQAAGDPAARSFLLDRHGRLRACAGDDAVALEALIHRAGQLANWPAADPPPP